MIEAKGISKSFGGIKAVDNLTATIQEGTVFGLIGTNGAGKSTFLRMVCGILKADEGSILVDGKPVYEAPEVKSQIFYISDEQYFFANANPLDMKHYYQSIYPGFDGMRFLELLEKFGLSGSRKINTFSKGMKKQLSVILGICANTKYLLCDETFDGLDPVMRQAVKSLFIKDIEERGLTPVVASHNLRELEDICDHVGLLHRGGILLSRDLDDMKLNIHKLQCVFKQPGDLEYVKQLLEVMKVEQRGSLITITVKGSAEHIEKTVADREPLFYELLPLSLEEIFISETEVAGYDIKNIIF
ncbi:MAG: ABC transporter ATP-binding protein [Lachnospiraceae bacterium]|nr:ABC transporter ATP-binding protein [Lachnospiraceae bacterium]